MVSDNKAIEVLQNYKQYYLSETFTHPSQTISLIHTVGQYFGNDTPQVSLIAIALKTEDNFKIRTVLDRLIDIIRDSGLPRKNLNFLGNWTNEGIITVILAIVTTVCLLAVYFTNLSNKNEMYELKKQLDIKTDSLSFWNLHPANKPQTEDSNSIGTQGK